MEKDQNEPKSIQSSLLCLVKWYINHFVSDRDTQYLFSMQRYFIGAMRALIIFFVISLQSVIAKPSHLQNGIEKSNNELMIKVN